MGFTVDTSVTLANGITLTGLNVSIRGNLSVQKTGANAYVLSSWVVYYVNNPDIPIQRFRMDLNVADPDITPYTAFYNALKAEFSGATFTDN